MADETVTIDIDVNTEEAEGKFVRLQTRIKETKIALQKAVEAGDTASITRLREELDNLDDQMEITTLRSKKFDDALAGLPGPAGQAGQALKGLDGAMKLLSANPIVAGIAALAAVLTTVIAAMKQTREGTAALTGVMDAFGNVFRPIVTFVSDVGVKAFTALGDAINWAATKLGLVDEEQVKAKENFRQLETSIKSTNAALENEIAILEAQGASVDKIAAKKKEQIDNEIQLLQLKKQAFGEITADEEAKIIELEGKKKVIDAQVDEYNKKKAAERLKKRQDDFNKDLDAYDFSQKSRAQITQKYFDDEKYALDKARAEGILTEDEYKQQLFELQQTQNEQALLEQDRFLKAREAKLREGLRQGLITQAEFDALTLQKQTETSAAKDAIVKTGYNQEISYIEDAAKTIKQLQDVQLEVNANIAQSWIDLGSTIGNTFGQLASLFEKGSAAQKVFGIASVVINGAAAVGKVLLDSKESISEAQKVISQGIAAKAKGAAIAPLNPIIGGALIATGTAASTTGAALLAKAKLNAGLQIAAIAATSAAQIAAIASAGKNKNASAVSAGAGGGGGQAATPAFSGTPPISAPQIGATVGQQGTIAGIVAGSIQANQSTSQPIRAYVVGNEIRTNAQLERRTRTMARLGG